MTGGKRLSEEERGSITYALELAKQWIEEAESTHGRIYGSGNYVREAIAILERDEKKEADPPCMQDTFFIEQDGKIIGGIHNIRELDEVTAGQEKKVAMCSNPPDWVVCGAYGGCGLCRSPKGPCVVK